MTATDFSTKDGIYTVEECQNQCKMDKTCSYFSFNEKNNECKMFDENAENKFKQDEPILYGPKECPSKFVFCHQMNNIIYKMMYDYISRFSISFLSILRRKFV